MCKSSRNYTIDEQMIINEVKSQLPHICYYCHKDLNDKDITVDHLTPISRSGKTIKENLVIACERCNTDKGNMTEKEYYTYINKKKELIDSCEVHNAINNLMDIQNNIIKRVEQIKNEYIQVEKQIEYLQQDILINTFNACDGYMYAKKLKELLIKRSELSLLKETYAPLHNVLGSQKNQIKDVETKVTEKFNAQKQLIRRQFINKSSREKDNVIRLDNII